MDQVSRPLLVVLLAVVVLAASWMAFLRPRAVESTTADVTAPAQVATQAAEAAKATDKASAATEAAADKVDESPAAPAPTAPAAKAAEKAKATAPAPAAKPDERRQADAEGEAAVLQAMDAGKVVVLLFFDKAGADDRAARASVKDLNLRDGKVVVHVADVKDVGRYDSVTQGVTVTQSPTTMIIARDGQTRMVNGLTDPTEVDQLVRAALQNK